MGKCIESYLLYHGGEAVGTCWAEVILQSYVADEVEVGIEDVVWCLSVEDSDEECYDALDDEGVTLCLEGEGVVGGLAYCEPHTTLTTVYEVVVGLVTIVHRRQFVAEVYEHLVTVHPVVKLTELFYYLVLYFVYCHDAKVVIIFDMINGYVGKKHYLCRL